MINYHNKTFRSVSNTTNGQVTEHTLFHYTQEANIVTAFYSGGEILKGHLIAVADEKGNLNMRYHHVNKFGELMTGICTSIPEICNDGRIRLYEKWKWTSGDMSEGESVVEEVRNNSE